MQRNNKHALRVQSPTASLSRSKNQGASDSFFILLAHHEAISHLSEEKDFKDRKNKMAAIIKELTYLGELTNLQEEVRHLSISFDQIDKFKSTDDSLEELVKSFKENPRPHATMEVAKKKLADDKAVDSGMKALTLQTCSRLLQTAIRGAALDLIDARMQQLDDSEKEKKEILHEKNELEKKLLDKHEQKKEFVKTKIKNLDERLEKLDSFKSCQKHSIERRLRRICPFLKSANKMVEESKFHHAKSKNNIANQEQRFVGLCLWFERTYGREPDLFEKGKDIHEQAASKVGRSRRG